jgi:hypothetical protein
MYEVTKDGCLPHQMVLCKAQELTKEEEQQYL